MLQHRPDPARPPIMSPAPAHWPGIAIERADPNQRADLPPVQGPQFGQRGQQGHRSHRADAGDAAQQPVLLTPDRAGSRPALHVIVEGLQTRFEPVNGRLDIRPHSGMGAGQAILLGGQHLNQLAPPWSNAAGAGSPRPSMGGASAGSRGQSGPAPGHPRRRSWPDIPRLWRNPAPGGD